MKVSGPLVAVSVAIHALLHGQEAGAGTLGWWLGALAASSLVTAIVVGTLRRLGTVWTLRLAVLLTLAGGVLALGPMTGLLTAAAG
jgi:urease accessory protein